MCTKQECIGTEPHDAWEYEHRPAHIREACVGPSRNRYLVLQFTFIPLCSYILLSQIRSFPYLAVQCRVATPLFKHS